MHFVIIFLSIFSLNVLSADCTYYMFLQNDQNQSYSYNLKKEIKVYKNPFETDEVLTTLKMKLLTESQHISHPLINRRCDAYNAMASKLYFDENLVAEIFKITL